MRSRRLRATAVIVAVVGFFLHMAPAAAQGDLLGAGDRKLERAEAAMDDIRARFGKSAVIRGRALKQPDSGNRGK